MHLPRLLAFLTVLLCFTACSTPNNGFTPTGGNIVWPPQKFTTVKAFAYDCHADADYNFFRPDGSLSKGVLKPGGVTLSAEQTSRLMKAITTPQPKSQRSPCYVPHHAFVFYTADGRVAGMLEICFTCNKHRNTPEGLPAYLDMTSIHSLVHELGLPLGSGKDFYRNIYKQQNPGAR